MKRERSKVGGRRVGRPPITDLPVPKDAKTVLVYGGTFDPPHFAHTVLPLIALIRIGGPKAWLLYVPAARNPLKAKGPGVSDEHRIAMLRRALELGGPRSIWTDEIDRAAWLRDRGRAGPSYMIDTLRRLRSVLPARVRLRLLVGSDQASTFHKWKDFREVVRLAEPLVMAREPVETVDQLYESLDADAWSREERAAWCARIAPCPPMPAASTGLRDAIARAPADPEAWERSQPLDNVITPVAAYIIAHRLYGHPGPNSSARPSPKKKPAGKGRRAGSKSGR